MDKITRKVVILLNNEAEEQEFVKQLYFFYKKECYIYAIIPEHEKELFNELSTDFIVVKPISTSCFLNWDIGQLGYIKDSEKQYIYISFTYDQRQWIISSFQR